MLHNSARRKELSVGLGSFSAGMTTPVEPATRKRVLKVIFFSLLLDLVRTIWHHPWDRESSRTRKTNYNDKQISFTFILPLFPKLLEFYRNVEAPLDPSAPPSKTLLSSVLGYLNTYKASFARPIDSRYDIVLLGGALGSLFSYVTVSSNSSPIPTPLLTHPTSPSVSSKPSPHP